MCWLRHHDARIEHSILFLDSQSLKKHTRCANIEIPIGSHCPLFLKLNRSNGTLLLK